MLFYKGKTLIYAEQLRLTTLSIVINILKRLQLGYKLFYKFPFLQWVLTFVSPFRCTVPAVLDSGAAVAHRKSQIECETSVNRDQQGSA